jgi:hypothetical protein
MSLREDRCLFTKLICKQIDYMNSIPGYEAVFDEGTIHRTKKAPTTNHKVGSKHELGLAMDILLYINKVYQTTTEAHKQFGEYWESLHPRCSWGGRFKDGNHYSFDEK